MRDEQIAMATGSVALALIAGALGFQYLGHITPCDMCHWQRWPLIAAILIGLGGGFGVARGTLNKKEAFAIALAALLLVAASGLIGAYQTGMQWNLLPGPAACTAPRYVVGSGMPDNVVRCDVVSWSLFGLSLAFYNAVFSLGTAILAAVMLKKNRP